MGRGYIHLGMGLVKEGVIHKVRSGKEGNRGEVQGFQGEWR